MACAAPYCIVNTVGIGASKKSYMSRFSAILYGAVEYGLIMMSVWLIYWLLGPWGWPIPIVLVLGASIVKSLYLHAFTGLSNKDLLWGGGLLITDLAIYALFLLIIGLPIANELVPTKSIFGNLELAQIISLWVVTGYPYVVLRWRVLTKRSNRS